MKRAAILLLGVLATLVGVNMTVWSFEKLRTDGSVVYLELAPKDPRSLMQGDYMALRLDIASTVRDALTEMEYVKQDGDDAADLNAKSVMRSNADAQPATGVVASAPMRSGFVIVQPDQKNIGRFVRVQADVSSLADKQFALPFRRSPQGVQVVTSDFFFAEGRAHDFDAARYGEFRVDTKGRAVLTGLLDENMKPL
ncbi:GDYXXLXY domain-containing protein [Pigmentiphaga aceris]|uniref:GDYXXLXY domain-containing protein n=1 Tax=Pigmentiphaga aceris TaxID=1940612 RepID=A0A5C0B2P7_9BURK|nr:GDYXXLXY domain-containing protein [Pigmentiphaga aceris]QEI07460.1 GDYXXLXY domain-containing protein [Pigmentiphaga aceris]